MTAAPFAASGRGVAALLAVTLIWAFSFGIIGKALVDVPPLFVGAVRLLVASLCFLPFLRLKGRSLAGRWELGAIGMVQFGIMYLCYLSAFQFLEAWQVALFSVFTPLWIAGLDALIRRDITGRFFLAALLSVAGALVIRVEALPRGDLLTGFLLMQLSNLAFAGGQVWFRQWKFRNSETPEKEVFALLYLGALAFTLLAAAVSGRLAPWPTLTGIQWATLVYLGLVASGLGFFLWNYGASRVSAGFLAAANNLVIPLGVLFAIVLNRSEPDWLTLLPGSTLIAAGLLAGRRRRPQTASS